jgi:ribonuclease HI
MRVELWCDGSGTTRGNPGGWAYILRAINAHGEIVKEVEASGAVRDATNNTMEMTALLQGLKALQREGCTVAVHSDSEYVIRAFTDGWIEKWERKRWVKVKNVELWWALVAEVRKHHVAFTHVPGHAGVVLNERCDRLAGDARRKAVEMLEDERAGLVVEDHNNELQLGLLA